MAQQGIYEITADDTLVINNQTIQTAADGGIFDLTRPNNLANAKVGKNGNGIIAMNRTGLVADLTTRLLMGNADDVYLLGLLNGWINNPTQFVLMTGTFTKNLGDGKGNQNQVTYTLAGGFFLKDTPMVSNPEGDTNQAVSIYSMQFLSAVRAIG